MPYSLLVLAILGVIVMGIAWGYLKPRLDEKGKLILIIQDAIIFIIQITMMAVGILRG